MKKYINYILLIIIFNSCASQHIQNNVKDIFFKHITVIEDFVEMKEDEVDGNKLQKSISFLENITKIKSSFYESFEAIKEPSKEDLKKWKKWYRKNKDRLYFDDKERKVKIK